jgi:hypothetical protein
MPHVCRSDSVLLTATEPFRTVYLWYITVLFLFSFKTGSGRWFRSFLKHRCGNNESIVASN